MVRLNGTHHAFPSSSLLGTAVSGIHGSSVVVSAAKLNGKKSDAVASAAFALVGVGTAAGAEGSVVVGYENNPAPHVFGGSCFVAVVVPKKLGTGVGSGSGAAINGFHQLSSFGGGGGGGGARNVGTHDGSSFSFPGEDKKGKSSPLDSPAEADCGGGDGGDAAARVASVLSNKLVHTLGSSFFFWIGAVVG